MCLFITSFDEKPQIAEVDIPIYKVVIRSSVIPDWYYSYYMKADIHLNRRYYSGLDTPSSIINRVAIEVGLHSFADFDEAKDFINRHTDYVNITMLKGHIPKRSRYYKGVFDMWNSYASDAIVYTEEVDKSEYYDSNKATDIDMVIVDYMDKLK